MAKRNVCILFGGISPEHEVSLRSAESVLQNLNAEKYNIFPVGITKEGKWILYGGTDYSQLPSGKWLEHPDNRPAAISPVRGQGLLRFEDHGVFQEMIDVVFPVLHGENGENGRLQAAFDLLGIKYTGSGYLGCAVSMHKNLSKQAFIASGVPTPKGKMVKKGEDISYEEFAGKKVVVKPCCGGSSIGVAIAENEKEFSDALSEAFKYEDEILVEEYIKGRSIIGTRWDIPFTEKRKISQMMLKANIFEL
jgi:D-alanine-D-alanine ligase